jgi:glutathione S-transferase
MQRKVPQSVGECYELIDREMLKGPWVMGERYSISDMYLFTLSQWMEGDGVDILKLPNVLGHRRRMAEHPVVKKVLAQELG